MAEQLAVIKNFQIGVGDRGVPAIWFETFINESSAALQVIYGATEIHDFIAQAGLESVISVNGKTCWVDVGPATIKFLSLAKI